MADRRPLVAALVLAASTALAAAEPVDPALFQDLRWRLIGPFRGGRVLAVAGVPGEEEKEHFYFGSVNGGVWETRDSGRTWKPIFDAQPIGSIGALAVAPSDSKVLYVGSGEADMRSDISQGDGMYKSNDGGRTWAHIGLADSQQIGRILIHPTNPNLVYVAALGHPYGPNAERGVYRSKDGGASWQKVLGGKDAAAVDVGATDLAFEPGNPQVIYAALWQTRRPPWSVYPPSNGPGSGLYKSIDGGDSWTPISGHGFPAKPGRIGLSVAPSQPRRVYAMVDDSEAGGLYRSDDGGATWNLGSNDKRIWGRGWYFGGITTDPKNPDVLFACNTNLYRSDDGGKNFVPIQGAPGGDDYHELWIDRENPARRILGTDQGAVVSQNGGVTWSSWYNQPTGQFYHVVTDGRFPYWVYGSQQDSGAAGVPSRTGSVDGINLSHFRETTAGGESDNIAPDPRDPNVLYGGRVDRLDLRTEQTRSISPTLAYPDRYRGEWTLPLVFSHRDPRVLYFSNQRLFRTEDGGEHWTVISPDLTRENPGAPANLDPTTAADIDDPNPRRAVIYAIAPSRLADHDLWVGTDDGLIWRTKDEGGHWENVTPAALVPWSKVGILETSHFDAETAYAAIDRHRVDDFKPYIYRTNDGGKSWALIVGGIPDGSFANAVREDPVRRGLLYAGTEKGVYVSFDDGAHWQPLQNGLPVTSVRDLEVHREDLVIATHGRAFWVLDGISPLRQLASVVTSDAAWLFAPAPAIRMRSGEFAGTPMPKDEPRAENPPPGAFIDYVLKKAATGPITLTIRDEQGGLVRRYSSADPNPAPDLAKLGTAPVWVIPPSTLSTEPSMHRFVWPLHYAAPEALAGKPGRRRAADGVWAPPGTYSVELDADGTQRTQTLTVLPDPRVTAAPEAYAQQFALARRIEQARAKMAATMAESETLLAPLAEQSKSADQKVAQEAARLQAKATAILGNAPGSAPPPLTSLKFASDRLDELAGAVESADAAPSPDVIAGFDAIQPKLAAALAAWETFKAKDLAPGNVRMKRGGGA